MLGLVTRAWTIAGLAAMASSVAACSFDWASLDPREAGTGGAGGAGGTATGGVGGSPSGSGTGTSTGSTTGSPSGTATGAGGSGTGADPDCLIALEDTFDVIDPGVWTTMSLGTGCSLDNPGGELTLSCAADPSPRAVGLESVAEYDLSACGVIVELESLTLNGDAEVEFAVFTQDTTVAFVLEGLNLAAVVAAPSLDVSSSDNFNPIADKWWRIRGEAGCVLWETSPDATTWSLFNDRCDLALSTMQVALRLSVSDPMSSVDVGFDNVNLP